MTGWPIKREVERYALSYFLDRDGGPRDEHRHKRRGRRANVGILGAAALAIAASLTAIEMQRSLLQSAIFSRWARSMSFAVTAGPSPSIRFPAYGPYDQRLGYTRIPDFVTNLAQRGYRVTQQAHPSGGMVLFQRIGGFPPYDKKAAAGLRLRAHRGDIYYAARHPTTTYANFAAIPKLVTDTLLFIENRELLDPGSARRNPAIEWDRLGLAVLQHGSGGLFGRAGPGGSTLATQLEKLHHSPDGRTSGISEKFRQMLSASIRAYHDGPDTRQERERIVVGVLNATPLAGVRGHGEVIGLGEGLALWFGADFAQTNAALRRLEVPGADIPPATALAYKQVVSLLIAQRRPSYYLRQGRSALEALTEGYLRVMTDSGLIDQRLGRAASAARLAFRVPAAVRSDLPPASAKAVNATRFELLRLLRAPSLYELDRLDLTADTALDAAVQAQVTEVLRSLNGAETLKALQMTGARLLSHGDPTRVAYSFTLFERGPTANYPRIQTDSLDRPLDLNIGTKLELGSTAKVRTLISYLEIIADLYVSYRSLPPAALAEIEATGDPLRRWVAAHLLDNGDPGLAGMMTAAMEKRYLAGTGERFFTAGGLHRFANFDRRHGGRMPVAKALQQSVNLVFIRMMRDIVDYHIANILHAKGDMVGDVNHPLRREYLARFADVEGRQFLATFYRQYRNLPPPEVLERIATRAKFLRPRLAAAFRTVLPTADYATFAALINRWALHKPDDAEAMRKLYDTYAPARLSLADRSYVSSIHPLELWLAGYLYRHPGANWDMIVAASADVRQEAYGWLFKSNRIAAQNKRIRILLEQEAFVPIHAQWQKLGYPFDHLVPSYATAIGTSGDRPDALAELMGIIVGNGVRLPTVRVERLRFAANTPYETVVEAAPAAAAQVLRPEIAAVVRQALIDTVESGTAKRASGVFHNPDGAAMIIGGKTGTGDNRTRRFARGRRLIDSVARTRTATFVFFIGDRWYGTVTAHVDGPEAARYRFTSALPTQLFKSLAPVLEPLIEQPRREPEMLPSRAQLPAVLPI